MDMKLPACPVETTLSLIGDKWKVLILRDLMSGTKRFGELKKSVSGISQKVLSENLRALESDGIISQERSDSKVRRTSLGVTGEAKYSLSQSPAGFLPSEIQQFASSPTIRFHPLTACRQSPPTVQEEAVTSAVRAKSAGSVFCTPGM